MYVYDDHSDIMKYSQFKQSLDEGYWTMDTEEDFGLKIGKSTPFGFPGKFLNNFWTLQILKLNFLAYTEGNPNVADIRTLSNFRQPPVVYLRQYFWPIFMPPIFQPPLQNLNFYQNPHDMKFIPQMVYPNYHPQQVNALPQSTQYMPCLMRQVPIPVQYNYHQHPPNYHQVIETHNYVPFNYFGAGIGGGHWV